MKPSPLLTATLVAALGTAMALPAAAAPAAVGAASPAADPPPAGPPAVAADRGDGSARLIVGLRPGADTREVLDQLAASGLVAPAHDVRRSGPRLVGAFPPAAVAALKADPRVAYVEPDQVATAVSTTQVSPPQGLDRLDQRDLPLSVSYTYERTGTGVRIYVADTGVRATHTDFGGRVTSGFDARRQGTTADCSGHGTHVAGVAAGAVHGVAKEATIVPVRVLDCEGNGSTSDVADGIDWASANHPVGVPGVVILSLASLPSTAVDDAVRRAVARGLTVVTAAGNGGADACGSSPARVAEAITVTASEPTTDQRPTFANTGTCVDLFAPGVRILSTWWTSDTATVTSSGTSMAAPHVAGIAATYLQAVPAATSADVQAAILTNATAGRIQNPGAGTPNLLAFSSFASLPEPEPEPGVPSPPRNVTAVAGERSAQVSWSPPAATGGSPVTGYVVHASPPAETRTVGAGTTATTMTGLEAGTTYRFAVVATNALGPSVPSEPSNPVTPSAPPDAEPDEPRAQEACPEDEVPPSGFGDIAGNVHEAAIDCIVWHGITKGTGFGLYGPRASVRRDQMASFIARQLRAAGVALPAPSDQGFRDIAGNVHADAINQLAALGVTQGTSATTFSPASGVRRDQLATFVDRAHQQVTGARLPEGRSQFTDIAGNVHARAINALAAAGIVQGVAPGSYAPARTVRRDQMAAFLARHLGVLGEAGHVTPPR